MSLRILSLDGGGIRGIIPAMILAELERRTERPVADMFDLVAGTSTGGILALALTCPDARGRPRYRAEDVVGLYERDGARIFHRSTWHRMRALGNLMEEKYPATGVEEVLEETLGDARLSRAVTNVLVTSYDIERRGPHFFKSHRAKKDPARDFLMRDAGRATSAAPTYFEPARVSVSEGEEPFFALVDGGVFANNPGTCAFVEGICEFAGGPGAIDLLSLGTGELTRPIPYDEAKDWGLAKWAQPILNVVFDGVSDTVNYQLESLFGVAGGRYDRIQAELHEGNDDMDDAGATNIRVLKLVAKEQIRAHSGVLDEWATLLTDPRRAPALLDPGEAATLAAGLGGGEPGEAHPEA